MGSDTDSSRKTDAVAALHRLRSTLARLKAELELAEADGTSPPVERLLEDLAEAFELLASVEDAEQPRRRVLVVDDDKRLADITARGLRRLGHEAESRSAIGDAKAGDVLVVDLGLLEGLDEAMLVGVRARRPIIVTGATDRGARARAAAVGASEYLVKPVELEVLAAAISRRLAET